MKKFLILLCLTLGFVTSASAISYEDVINDLKNTANYTNIQAGDTIVWNPILLGNILEMNNANAVIRQNQIGGQQTRYYGNLLFEQMKLLPVDEIVSSYFGEGVMLALYARTTEIPGQYDMLILYDSSDKGLSCAIQGLIPQKTYDILQEVTVAYDGYGNLGLYTKLIGFGAHY